MVPAGPLLIPKLSQPPRLTWRVPGSKSITNRALVLAALAEGESTLEGVLHSDDTRHMRNALSALGVAIDDLGPDDAARARWAGKAPSAQGTAIRGQQRHHGALPGCVGLLGAGHCHPRG